jgi:hypothetical protein
LGLDVPRTFFNMSSTDVSAPTNTSLWLTSNSGVSPGAITEVLTQMYLLSHNCFEHFRLGV